MSRIFVLLVDAIIYCFMVMLYKYAQLRENDMVVFPIN
jgi:hypothetical protein